MIKRKCILQYFFRNKDKTQPKFGLSKLNKMSVEMIKSINEKAPKRHRDAVVPWSLHFSKLIFEVYSLTGLYRSWLKKNSINTVLPDNAGKHSDAALSGINNNFHLLC